MASGDWWRATLKALRRKTARRRDGGGRMRRGGGGDAKFIGAEPIYSGSARIPAPAANPSDRIIHHKPLLSKSSHQLFLKVFFKVFLLIISSFNSGGFA